MSLLNWPRFLRKRQPALDSSKHVCDPDRSLRWKLRIEAGDILMTARPLWLRRHNPVDWGGPDHMHRAFALYNIHHPAAKQGIGCAPCHIKVFNWLMDQAFNDHHPDQQ